MRRVVIIGSSGHWQYAIRGLSSFPEATLAGIAPGLPEELDQTRLAFREQLSEGIPLHADWRQMLDSLNPDVAVINPYFHLHATVTLECLSRGIHCFTEKPLALHHHELNAIRDRVEGSGVRLSTMMPYRYDPVFYAMYEAVKDGKVGQPLQITAQKSYICGRKPAWQHARKTFGGLIGWVGSHALDWICWITGNDIGYITAAETSIGNRGNGEMESSSIVLIHLRNGGQASANIDYLRPHSAPSHGDDRLRIAGTEGVAEVLNGKVTLICQNAGVQVLEPAPSVDMFADFLKTLDNPEHPYRQSHGDIWATTDACIRAQLAADTH